MHRRSFRAPVALLVFACGVLLSATIDHGQADAGAASTLRSPFELPYFRVESGRGRLLLEGTTASGLHESGLLQLAADHFGALEIRTDFAPGIVLADDWETASSRLLYALAATESAHASMRADTIDIRGVTADPDAFSARIRFLREGLRDDTSLVTDVVSVAAIESQQILCRRAFAQLFIEPVSFRQSSTDIRSNSYGTLDRIIDFAFDCPQATIAITGHTDASGDETWNRHLSLARAQAVARHLEDGGVEPRRLLVKGLGSSQPVADNSTPHGRDRNRRIEFSLR